MNFPPLRTLFLTRHLPYPPLGGAALRNWQNINIMKKYGDVAIFSVCRGHPEQTSLTGIDFCYHYNIDQPLSRWEKLEHQLWPLRPFAYPGIDNFSARNAVKKLEEILQIFKPNLVIFEELWLYQYLQVIKRYPCQVIFDNHNIEADLFEQNHGVRKLQLPRLKAIERDFIRQADQVWVCSQEEIKLLEKLYGKQSKVYSIPNTINVSDYEQVYLNQADLPSNLEPRNHDILFLGQYNYPPNRIAAQILIEDIYPQLKQIYPDCRLLLVGRNPNSLMLKSSQEDPDIIVTGSVPDVRPYLAAASVMLVPLQQGGGTRLKVLEAFASGCPIISTKKGAEGLLFDDGVHLIIKDTPEEMIKGVIDLWSNEFLGKKLRQKGRELAESQYSWQAVKGQIDTAIQSFIL